VRASRDFKAKQRIEFGSAGALRCSLRLTRARMVGMWREHRIASHRDRARVRFPHCVVLSGEAKWSGRPLPHAKGPPITRLRDSTRVSTRSTIDSNRGIGIFGDSHRCARRCSWSCRFIFRKSHVAREFCATQQFPKVHVRVRSRSESNLQYAPKCTQRVPISLQKSGANQTILNDPHGVMQ
jgi:hypothetical protein